MSTEQKALHYNYLITCNGSEIDIITWSNFNGLLFPLLCHSLASFDKCQHLTNQNVDKYVFQKIPSHQHFNQLIAISITIVMIFLAPHLEKNLTESCGLIFRPFIVVSLNVMPKSV